MSINILKCKIITQWHRCTYEHCTDLYIKKLNISVGKNTRPQQEMNLVVLLKYIKLEGETSEGNMGVLEGEGVGVWIKRHYMHVWN